MKRLAYFFIMASVMATGGCINGKLDSLLRPQPANYEQLSQADRIKEEAALRKAVEQDPANASAQHSLGRILLLLDKPQQATTSLKKAADLDRRNADYQLWLGVAYGESEQYPQEQASYRRALEIDPQHLPALVLLGNSYLKSKMYQPGLSCYQRALKIDPSNSQALYNRAIIYKQLKQTAAERLAWKLYLETHPAGILARKATEHLNRLNDFSYRNHYIGNRVLTLPAITYTPFAADLNQSDKECLDKIGRIVTIIQNPLNVLVFQKNNIELARNRALRIKQYLEKEYPLLAAGKRIQLSWFGSPEKTRIAGHTYLIDDSTLFFTTAHPQKPIKLNKQSKKKRQ
jgi:tetratricopeptide (TPR) repeat protein